MVLCRWACLGGSGDWDTVCTDRDGLSLEVQFPGRPVDLVFGFQGGMIEINFSDRQGFNGALYNLWPLANIELSDAQ